MFVRFFFFFFGFIFCFTLCILMTKYNECPRLLSLSLLSRKICPLPYTPPLPPDSPSSTSVSSLPFHKILVAVLFQNHVFTRLYKSHVDLFRMFHIYDLRPFTYSPHISFFLYKAKIKNKRMLEIGDSLFSPSSHNMHVRERRIPKCLIKIMLGGGMLLVSPL